MPPEVLSCFNLQLLGFHESTTTVKCQNKSTLFSQLAKLPVSQELLFWLDEDEARTGANPTKDLLVEFTHSIQVPAVNFATKHYLASGALFSLT